MKTLLMEYSRFNYNASSIMESVKNNGGRFIVEGILQRAEAVNQNGRVYPRSILEREVNRYQSTEVKEKRALGELDHPESQVVNLRNVSHNILQTSWKGDDVWGKVEVLNTPSGKILQELFKHGITLGISSRGLGSVKQLSETTTEVQSDFQLVCWDFVSNPSTQNAFMAPVMEGVNTPLYLPYQESHNICTSIICELSGVCCIN